MKKIFSVSILLSIIILIISYNVYNKDLDKTAEAAHHSQEVKEKERKAEVDLQTKYLIESIDKLSYDESEFLDLNNTIIKDLSNQEAVSIVFLGDSTTEQNQYTKGDPGHVNIIKNKLQPIYSDSLRVINEGISGNNSGDMLKRVGKSVVDKKPDYVVVSSGINDSVNGKLTDDFNSNIEKIIQTIQKETEATIILRTSNPTLGEDLNIVLQEQINMDLENLAKKHKVGFIDTFGIISSDEENGKYDFSKYMTDIYHPNGKGQEVIANTILYGLFSSETQE